MKNTQIKTLPFHLALTFGLNKTNLPNYPHSRLHRAVSSLAALSALGVALVALPASAQFNNTVNMPTVNLKGQGGSIDYNAGTPGTNTTNTNNNVNNGEDSALSAPSKPVVRSPSVSRAAQGNGNKTDNKTEMGTDIETPSFMQPNKNTVNKANGVNGNKSSLPGYRMPAPNAIQSSRSGITLQPSTGYVQDVKSRYRALEQARENQPITLTPVDEAKRMELSRDNNYKAIAAIPPQVGNTAYVETGVSFIDTKTSQPLLVDEIDFDRSFVAVSSVQGQDVGLSVVGLKDIVAYQLGLAEAENKSSQSSDAAEQLSAKAEHKKALELMTEQTIAQMGQEAFVYDEATALDKSGQSLKCSASTLYLTTKNLNNFTYALNRYDADKCGRVIMVADNGTLNAKDDRFINVTIGEQNKKQLVKLDILKEGWSEPQAHLIFGQPALMVLVNPKLEIFVAPQVDRNNYHYAKVGQINYKNYKMSSPFTYKTTLPKQKTYRAFAVTQGDEKINYYPTTVFVEDLDAQYKLISQ